ncbi:hypothetical protein A5819_003546 [Enterococcus sp. 7E2_DIV0204]|uniref:hypothetical protein n=1 Tax=unclassified Enterococcus TaxID=2608891 RepID=UPI000A357A81|nr:MULTISPECIES: hypothetical protein [unclassified Enterococcus]OTN83996.1 hypothetical protein A5819_003546 [Enterococcus sp. 7E2_DIV0204]OTP47221.1 hypothetical protein A5884_003596 [Enterococcus sp. 7D2_DIV0200]
MIVLTEEQREAIINTMSENQRQVLFTYKRRDIQSMFLNKIFSEDDEWEYDDYHESSYYQNSKVSKKERLYCACGKEVKYQYVLRTKKSQQKIGLSLQHLSDHTNIPLSIARNIKAGIQEIDRHLDGILIMVRDGEGFQKEILNFTENHSVELEISTRLKETMNAFASVDLPLSWKDYWSVKKKINTFEKERSLTLQRFLVQERKERILSRKRPKNLQSKELLDDIIVIIDTHYIQSGSWIDIREIVRFLVEEYNYVGDRLIGYVGPIMQELAEEICPGHLTRESFYNYRKTTHEKLA